MKADELKKQAEQAAADAVEGKGKKTRNIVSGWTSPMVTLNELGPIFNKYRNDHFADPLKSFTDLVKPMIVDVLKKAIDPDTKQPYLAADYVIPVSEKKGGGGKVKALEAQLVEKDTAIADLQARLAKLESKGK